MTLHVLIVEDDLEVARALDRLFGDWSSTLFSTAEGALTYLRDHRPDAVVTDWNLVDGQGRPVADWCIEHGIPFRVFSGDSPESDLRQLGVWLSKLSFGALRDFKEGIEGSGT